MVGRGAAEFGLGDIQFSAFFSPKQVVGIGQIFKIDQLPTNLQAGYYYNVEHPDDGSRHQVRLLLMFLFPK
jgi:hypothetical protein